MKTFLGIDKDEWEYFRYIVYQNLVVSIFILLFVWDGWDMKISKYITLGSVIEVVLLLTSIPLYFLFALKLFDAMKKGKLKTFSFVVCSFLSILLIAGIGMRFAANQIRMSADLSVVEFFDEYLSHYLIWTGIIGLNVFFGFFQDSIPLKKNLGNSEMKIIVFSAVLQGLIAAMGILESRVGVYSLIAAFIFFCLLNIGQSEKKFRKYPLYVFYNVCLITVVLFLLGWLMWFGYFAEPSSINLGRF